VILVTGPPVLRERYAIRVDTRHPGHADAERLAHPETEISEAAYPALRLGGPVEILDTTRFATVEIDPVLAACAEHVLRHTPDVPR
jgi:hypothetical protein